jgi:membrane dipeptidase
VNAKEPFVVDAHNDLLLELEFRSAEENPFSTHWLTNLRRGGIGLQICPIFAELSVLPEGALPKALRQVVAFHRAARENANEVIWVRTRHDLEMLESDHRIGMMLAMEGVEALGYSPELADVFWELGVRMVSLTWNRRNPFADGLGEPTDGGLSELGRDLVSRLVSLGVIIDLAHASERTFYELLELRGTASVVVSHACCRAVCNTPRNLSDEQLHALAAHGGVVGLMALQSVVDPDTWSIDRLVDHIDHVVDLIGIDHVGLGGDFIRQVFQSGATRIPTAAQALYPPGVTAESVVTNLAGPEDYPNLIEALQRRGYRGKKLNALLGGNFLRLCHRALPDA